MKNKLKLAGIMILVVVCFAMLGCGEGGGGTTNDPDNTYYDTRLTGTWQGTNGDEKIAIVISAKSFNVYLAKQSVTASITTDDYLVASYSTFAIVKASGASDAPGMIIIEGGGVAADNKPENVIPTSATYTVSSATLTFTFADKDDTGQNNRLAATKGYSADDSPIEGFSISKGTATTPATDIAEYISAVNLAK